MTSSGVGTELKKLLPSWIVKDHKSCGCENAVQKLDRYGVEWCEENASHIAQYLVDQSEHLIPAFRLVPLAGRSCEAKRIVKKAIKNAKR